MESYGITMTQWETEDCAAVSLYRFFAAFAGFDAAHPLGFEAMAAGSGGSAAFYMEPAPLQLHRYINGAGRIGTACIVRCLLPDDDTRTRRRTAAFFAALNDYIGAAGGCHTDGTRHFRIRPVAYPARTRLEGGGAVWELRCRVEISENNGEDQEG